MPLKKDSVQQVRAHVTAALTRFCDGMIEISIPTSDKHVDGNDTGTTRSLR